MVFDFSVNPGLLTTNITYLLCTERRKSKWDLHIGFCNCAGAVVHVGRALNILLVVDERLFAV